MDTLWSPDKNKGSGRIPNPLKLDGVPKGIRTPVADVKGRCPWPTRRWGPSKPKILNPNFEIRNNAKF